MDEPGIQQGIIQMYSGDKVKDYASAKGHGFMDEEERAA